MAKDYPFRVSVEDEATAKLQKLAGTAKREMGKVQDELDDTSTAGKKMADVLGTMADDVESNLRELEAVTERVGRALGEDAADDARRFAVALRSAGLTVDDIDQDCDELVVQLKRLESAAEQSGMGVKRGMDDASGGVKHLGAESDQSRSVIANMVGNSTQDLGALGGVAGSAGVAIGQLAEYAADGNIKLKSLVGLVSGMGLLAIAGYGVQKVFGEIAETKAFNRDQIDGWVDALREGKSATEALVDTFTEAGKVEVNVFGDTEDITEQLAAIGLSVEDFAHLTQMSREDLEAWGAAMADAGVDTGALAAVVLGAAGSHDNLDEAQRGAAASAAVFGTTTHASAEAMDAAAQAGDDYRAALEELNDAQDAALGNNIDLADAMLNTADALDEYAATMGDAEASDRDKQRAGNDLISTMLQEAASAGQSAADQATAAGNAAGAQAASTAAQIGSLTRLAQSLAPGSYLRNQIESHINALRDIPTSINTTVRVNTSYGQGTDPIRQGGGAIPWMDTGGVIPGPPGAPVPMVGHAGEIVVNAMQQENIAANLQTKAGGSMGGQPPNINITVNAGFGADGDDIGNKMIDILNRWLRGNGDFPWAT